MAQKQHSSNWKKDIYFLSILLGFPAIILFCAFLGLVVIPERRFKQKVQMGMTKAQVEAAVGPPTKKLAPGELVKVDSFELAPVQEETWAYKTGVLEFRLAFDGETVVRFKRFAD